MIQNAREREWSGWVRLGLTVVFMAGGMYKTIDYLGSQQSESRNEMQEDRKEFRAAAEGLRVSIEGLRGEVTKLANAQERIAEHIAISERDTERRLDRLEHVVDGKHL